MSAFAAVLAETFLDTGERGPLRLLSNRALLVTWAHLMDPQNDFAHQKTLLVRVEWEAKQRRVELSLRQSKQGGTEAHLRDNLASEHLIFPMPFNRNANTALRQAAFFYDLTQRTP